MVLFACIYFLFVSSTVGADVVLFPAKPVGMEDEALTVTVHVNQPPFSNCGFANTAGNYSVNETNSSFNELTYTQDDSRSSCTLTISKMANKFKGGWYATIGNGTTAYTATFSIGMEERTDIKTELFETALVGSNWYQYCAPAEKQLYAKVFNPAGELVEEGPDTIIEIPFVRVQDNGTWKCHVQMSDRVNEVVVKVHLNVSSELTVRYIIEEEGGNVRIICRSQNNIYKKCMFETPSGELISPREGVTTGRYSYFGNGLDYDCGLAIQAPLEDKEKGWWKCMMSSIQTSGFLQVGGVSNIGASSKRSSISIIEGTDLSIQCSMRQALTFCYARSPKGKIFSDFAPSGSPNSKYTGLGLDAGDCQITIPAHLVNRNDSGTWQCGMGSSFIDDVKVPIAVSVAGKNFTATNSLTTPKDDNSALIECKSVLGYAIEYCRFISPTGDTINLMPSANQGKYSYRGRGLETGECGLLIKDVEDVDLGIWVCATRFAGSQYDFQDNILITEAPLGTASIVGITVSMCLAISALVGGFVFYRVGKRWRSRTETSAIIRYSEDNDSTNNQHYM